MNVYLRGDYTCCCFFAFVFSTYKCCCKHLLTISKVLETLEHPFQSYVAFCQCTFTYLYSKLEETRTGEAYGEAIFCGIIKWLTFTPGSSSATENAQISS